MSFFDDNENKIVYGVGRRIGSETTECARCGNECTWHHTGERWVLLDDSKRIHTPCSGASVDDFDDLTSE